MRSGTPSGKNPDSELRGVVDAIVRNDGVLFRDLIAGRPELAKESFREGAGRGTPAEWFVAGAGQYIYEGDTALHFAAACYRAELAAELIRAGARVRARNRRGGEAIHAAAAGQPGSERWNPEAQAATIVVLVRAGADPNAQNMDGATALHRAVRTRCAGAVRALLECGADREIRNKNGSRAVELAGRTTGRGGAGSEAAKAQLREIVELLRG